MQEVAPNPLPGKDAKNGLHLPALGKDFLEPHWLEPESSSEEGVLMEHRMRAGPTTTAFGVCRPPGGETPRWGPERGKGFGRKADLGKEPPSQAGQCSYICSDCGRSFTEHSSLPSCQGVGPLGNAFVHTGCRRKSSPAPHEPVAHRKERKELSLQEKVRVLEILEGPKVSQSELAKRFGVSQPQICRIIKNKERILAEWCSHGPSRRKRPLEGQDAAHEASLLPWLEPSWEPGRATQGKAPSPLETPEWDDWLAGFKPRQKAARKRPRAEKRPDGEAGEEEGWENAVLPHLLRQYDPPDVYACGEAGILFRATPEDLGKERRDKAEDQLTVLLCANLDASDKRDALIVGKGPQPLCFRGVSVEERPVTYRANTNAWMTAAVFSEWLQKFDEDMKSQQRRVVLFLTQCAAHPSVELPHVKMVFLPPQPPWAHPLEQGIVQAFKCHYRWRMLTRLLAALDSKASASPSKLAKQHLTLLDAVHMIVQAWSEVSPETVTNSFRAAGFGLSPRIPAPPGEVVRAFGFTSQDQFEQFVLLDDGLACFAQQDGAETASGDRRCEEPSCAAAAEGEERADDAATLLSCPSKADVMESLAKLRRYLECHAASPAMFQTFYKLEDVVHGMSLAHLQVSQIKDT